VLLAGWAVQRWLHREKLTDIGIRVGSSRGVVTAMAVSLLLVSATAVWFAATGSTSRFQPNATWLALGILAQGGIAEELVFRGYLFGHLRRMRPFWRAALLSVAPFSIVHLTLFVTMDWPVALAALVLSIALSFPYARLYELSGGAIWAPALLHAVTQAAPKLLIVEGASFPIVWMAIVLIVSWLIFFIPAPREALGAK
jgi:membrane protease YdiL (CAAX protease family)